MLRGSSAHWWREKSAITGSNRTEALGGWIQQTADKLGTYRGSAFSASPGAGLLVGSSGSVGGASQRLGDAMRMLRRTPNLEIDWWQRVPRWGGLKTSQGQGLPLTGTF